MFDVHAPVPRGRSAAPRLQELRNPLTRVGYALAGGCGHVMLLAAGEARLRGPGPEHAVGPELAAGQVLWLPDGGERELVCEAGARGTLLSAPHMVLREALPPGPLAERIRRTLSQPLVLPVTGDMPLGAELAALAAELAQSRAGSELAVGHRLALILVHLWRGARVDLVAHGHAPQGLVEGFVLLANRHRREQWPVAAYATALGVTRDRLGTAVRRATGLSPQAYLHRGLVQEACQLLADTGMPVAQIGFRLGFSEAGYFTRFFRRLTGQTPRSFRQIARRRRQEGDQSYAAWP